MFWGGRDGGLARGSHGWIGVAATLKGMAALEKGVGDGLGWGGWGVALFRVKGRFRDSGGVRDRGRLRDSQPQPPHPNRVAKGWPPNILGWPNYLMGRQGWPPLPATPATPSTP